MQTIPFDKHSSDSFRRLFDAAKIWCGEHQLEIGAVEMGVGAALISWGVQNGLIEMGKDVVATVFSDQFAANKIGAAIGGALGTLPGIVLGSIGIGALGGAIGIPAAIVIGGGAFIFSSLGYTVTDLVAEFLKPDLIEFLKLSSVALVGAALLVDGARRMISDPRVLEAASRFADGVLHLTKLVVKVIARSIEELNALMSAMFSLPNSAEDAAGSAAAAAGMAAGGAAAGGAIAAGTVTVLGSNALGAAALSLGLISAPVWPIVAGGVVGLAVGYAAWKAARHFGSKFAGASDPKEPPLLEG